MSKTLIILQQEYLKRVKKKSFIVLTLLVPLLFAGMFALIIALSVHDDKQERTIAVYDESTLFLGELEQEGYTRYGILRVALHPRKYFFKQHRTADFREAGAD